MAETTEQDPIKTIAIKLPFDLQQRLLTFPFLHALKEHHPEAEIHFITPKKQIEVLNLLPFKAYYHEFDEGEIKSLFDVHRYCVEAKIFNVDLFVSLTNSFVDACLGFGLRAKHRLGFADGWKTLVLNEKTPRPQGHHICEDFFALFKVHTHQDFNVKLRIMSRDLPPVIADWDSAPYVAINLHPLSGGQISEEWVEFVSRFEGQRFIFFSEEQELSQMHMERFLSKLSPKNAYMNFVYPDWIELSKMLAFARGVVTYNGPVASIAAYVGSKTLVLYDWENPQKTGPFYYLADTAFMTLEGRKVFNMESVASKAFDFFKL